MRYLIRQKISLQLLSLYLLFVLPVLLGGVGLYLFQQNALTQNAFQSDLGLAQAVALEVDSNLQAATEIDIGHLILVPTNIVNEVVAKLRRDAKGAHDQHDHKDVSTQVSRSCQDGKGLRGG